MSPGCLTTEQNLPTAELYAKSHFTQTIISSYNARFLQFIHLYFYYMVIQGDETDAHHSHIGDNPQYSNKITA